MLNWEFRRMESHLCHLRRSPFLARLVLDHSTAIELPSYDGGNSIMKYDREFIYLEIREESCSWLESSIFRHEILLVKKLGCDPLTTSLDESVALSLAVH